MYFVGLNRRQRQRLAEETLSLITDNFGVALELNEHSQDDTTTTFQSENENVKIYNSFLLYSGKYNLKVVMAQAKLALSSNSLIFSCLQVDLLVAASTPTSVLSLGWHRALTLDRRLPSPGGMSRRA